MRPSLTRPKKNPTPTTRPSGADADDGPGAARGAAPFLVVRTGETVNGTPATDTIVALATPSGSGGLAVVRVSGPEALAIAGALLPGDARLATVRTHRVFRADPRDPVAGEVLDNSLVLPMLGPDSFTGEDIVEFHCHGGDWPARRVIDACIAAGARPAGPGEFTRRAFLNGRLGLDQAEAVADLIGAENRLAARGSLKQLRGALRDEIARLERPLVELLAELEGGLEFGEDEARDVPRERIVAELDAARNRVDALLIHAESGRRLRDGVQVVIAGSPNAGKSTLFNALLGEARALVDPEPGTTRDVITERLEYDGIVYVLHDTAGLRDDADRVEAQGVARAREVLDRADVVLHVFDLTTGRPAHLETGAPVVRVGAKADLAAAGAFAQDDVVITSARDGRGLDALMYALHKAARADRLEQAAALGLVLNRRHAARLTDLRDELDHLVAAVEAEAAPEVVCTLLQSALCGLGEITGRVFSEALLDEVFSRFCVGK